VADRQFGCKIKKIGNVLGENKNKKSTGPRVMTLISKIVINIQRIDDKEENNKFNFK
jgi:hypothetical protein